MRDRRLFPDVYIYIYNIQMVFGTNAPINEDGDAQRVRRIYYIYTISHFSDLHMCGS